MERLVVVLLCLFVVIQAAEFPEETVSRQRRRGDNSHWCCENEIPVEMIKRSRTKVEYKQVGEKIKTGTKSCGLLSTCSVYETIYRTEPQFGTEYYAVPHKEACPDEAVKCCKGYLLIVGNCLSLEEIASSGMTIEELIQSKLMEEGKK